MTTFCLPWPPTVNTYYRHVVMGGSSRTLISKRGREYQTCCDGMHVMQWSCRLAISLEFHAPTRRKYDLDNRAKAVLDALQHGGIIEDDELIDHLTLVRGEIIPRNGKVVVTIDAIRRSDF